MYGTIFSMRPKEGKEGEIESLFDEWNRERKDKVGGAVATYLFKLDKGGMMGVAVFDSEENYQANAQDPEQDAWFQRLRSLLEDDPEWHDGEVVTSS